MISGEDSQMMISIILLPGKIPWGMVKCFLLGLDKFFAYLKYGVNLLSGKALIKLPLILAAVQQYSLLYVTSVNSCVIDVSALFSLIIIIKLLF